MGRRAGDLTGRGADDQNAKAAIKRLFGPRTVAHSLHDHRFAKAPVLHPMVPPPPPNHNPGRKWSGPPKLEVFQVNMVLLAVPPTPARARGQAPTGRPPVALGTLVLRAACARRLPRAVALGGALAYRNFTLTQNRKLCSLTHFGPIPVTRNTKSSLRNLKSTNKWGGSVAGFGAQPR